MSPSPKYLLDTNVISETRKSRPDPNVVHFLQDAPLRSLYLSALTLGELRKGIALRRPSDPSAAEALSSWVDDLEAFYADRILPVDRAVARIWGELSAIRSRPVIDTLLAATALHHGLTLVTRNVSDVEDTSVPLLNPWRP